MRALERTGAPPYVVEAARALAEPRKPRPPGKTTFQESGSATYAERHRRAEGDFQREKPATHRAFKAAGLSKAEIARRAGIGRETLRNAIRGEKSTKLGTAAAIVRVLDKELSLSKVEKDAITTELVNHSRDSRKNNQNNV